VNSELKCCKFSITGDIFIQGDSVETVNILGGGSIGHCEKKVNMNTCQIMNGYPDTAL